MTFLEPKYAFYVACLLATTITPPIRAQRPGPGPDRLAWGLSYSNWQLDDAKVDDTNGSFSVTRQRTKVQWRDFSFTYQRWDFDWSNVSALPFGDGIHDPWESLESIKFSGRMLRHLGGRWTYLVGLSAGFVYEADTSDSFGASLFGGVGYALDRQSIIRLGGLVSYHPIRTVVWPMIGFDLRSKSGFSATLGFPKTGVKWQFSPHWAVSLSALADRAVARLADDSTVEPNGYLDTTSYFGALGLTYKPIPSLSIDLSLAQSISRSVTFYDEDGHKTNDFDVDRTPGILLGISYRF